MRHTMNLRPTPFAMIESGKKTFELRLYDEKRQQINVGDEIEFINTENNSDRLHTTVEKIHRFRTFEELYRELPLLQCGYTEQNVGTATARDMEKYYSREKQEKYGVVAFQIVLRD